jgi:hypothetical protein
MNNVIMSSSMDPSLRRDDDIQNAGISSAMATLNVHGFSRDDSCDAAVLNPISVRGSPLSRG